MSNERRSAALHAPSRSTNLTGENGAPRLSEVCPVEMFLAAQAWFALPTLNDFSRGWIGVVERPNAESRAT